MPNGHRSHEHSQHKGGATKGRKPAQRETDMTPSHADEEPLTAQDRDEARGRPLEQQNHITPDGQ